MPAVRADDGDRGDSARPQAAAGPASRGSAALGLIDVVGRGFEAVNRRDFDAVISFLAPDCVWEGAAWGLGTYTGLAANRRFYEDWIGSFDDYRLVVEEMLGLGSEVVFVVATQYAHSPGSRGQLRLRSASIFIGGEGLVTRMLNYPDIDTGRAIALRLAESGASARSS